MRAVSQAASKIREWREHPALMVEELFQVKPDLWQRDVLEAFAPNPRLAMKACKGPGKTTVLAWLNWNFLLTRPHPKMAAVSITADNLADGLWAELAKWQNKSQLLKESFKWTKTRVCAVDHPETWFLSARAWPKGGSSEQQADTLAGLHADYLLFTLDEAGGIPDAVMAAAEAGLANAMGGGGHEAHIVMAGNPTHTEGPLWRACTKERSLWHVIEITSDPDDPKRTPRVSIEWARQQISKYGRENPWVLVNVFGKFPPSSINALLSPDDVAMARKRYYPEVEFTNQARILGVDVARFGLDSSVLSKRQGLVLHPQQVRRNLNGVQGAGWVSREWEDWKADGCFVDDTGGFGASWIDQLRVLNRTPIGIHFAASADNERYANKRAEMHFEFAEWIKRGGAIPDDDELAEELTAITYTFKGDKLILADKDQIKEILGRSPDKSDSGALTFAGKVAPGQFRPQSMAIIVPRTAARAEYNSTDRWLSPTD
ncbi:MAG TPA: hypothetical protein VFZ38_10805 [Vicinamibacterales bacterium]